MSHLFLTVYTCYTSTSVLPLREREEIPKHSENIDVCGKTLARTLLPGRTQAHADKQFLI